MKLVFATGNSGKLREAAEILGEGVRLLSPRDLGVAGEAEETEKTFAGNSLLKARYVYDALSGLAEDRQPDGVFADDSGLETDALGGEPGIYTARYAGEDKNFADNMDKLLAKLREAGATTPESRSARFRCVVTLIGRDGRISVSEGSLEGSIAFSKSGCGGFGYDPVFIPTDRELAALSRFGFSEEEIAVFRGKTLAEIPENVKNLISHRFKALTGICPAIQSPA